MSLVGETKRKKSIISMYAHIRHRSRHHIKNGTLLVSNHSSHGLCVNIQPGQIKIRQIGGQSLIGVHPD